MKIAQVIPNLGNKSGGPSRSVYLLTKGLRHYGCETQIITNNDLNNPNIATEEWIKAVDINHSLPFGYNPSFKRLISSSDCNLFHIHSLYNYSTTIAIKFAKKNKIPYVISPRGTLYQNALKKSSPWKKRLFNEFILLSYLNDANAIHATCVEEMNQIRRLGITSPIAIVPNAITIPNVSPVISTPEKYRLVFVGRINPIKNIDGLIKAWSLSGLSKKEDAELVIIGEANLEKETLYKEQLLKLESDLGISNIVWAGEKYGEDKERIIKSCSYLILPSHSENFGMVIPEALIMGVPAIASKDTPWDDLLKYECGYWVENSTDSMAQILKKTYELPEDFRKKMGLNGQMMVQTLFSTETVSKKMISLYDWIAKKGDKPDFVF